MKTNNKVRVLVVEDSLTVRELLRQLIEQDGRLDLMASVASAEEALRFLENDRPDVISMDIHLPGMNGMDATRRIMQSAPTPIVIVSVTTRARDAAFSMEALRVGALSVIEKPVGPTHPDFAHMARNLCNQLVAMSQVRLVKQRLREPPDGGHGHSTPRPVPFLNRTGAPVCIGIAASTGGPRAVSALLNGLGPLFPLPILLVQHMTPNFLEPFVAWLDQTTPFTVEFASDGMVPVPGHVYHAPAERQLRIRGGRFELSTGPEDDSLHCPSADAMFRSLAREFGSRSVGIVLTGMGDDGAKGLAEMRASGAHTIAEDESTAVVFGMPQAAYLRGAVCEQLPLNSIAARVRQHIARSGEAVS